MNILDFKHGLFQYEVKDYYSILGVPLDASARDIRLRYLKIAYQLHPDTCRVDTPEGKEKASQILSKLVNPAYENLYKDKLRKECQLILSETGRRLASDAYQVEIVTDTGKKLYAEENNFESLYKEMLGKISPDLYADINKVKTKIALISELNLVYLLRSKQNEGKPKTASATSSTVQQTTPIVTKPPSQNSPTSVTNTQSQSKTIEEDESTGNLGNTLADRIKKIHKSAKRHQENNNLEQGIIDLREALKLDPNNATTHGLIACLYLQQGNLPYARIHSKKGMGLDANDTYVKQSQAELKEIQQKETQAKKQGKQSSSGKKDKDSKGKSKKATSKSKKDKDGKGKKEAPKIFGIPLW